MESSSNSSNTTHKDGKTKGGVKTMPFIIANEAFEKIAAYGLQPNMIFYLITSYNFTAASGTSTLFIWNAISNFMPILGALIADSYLGRFIVISLGTLFVLTGMTVMLLTAILSKVRPPPCTDPAMINCVKPNAGQYAFLFTAFAFIALGTGGVRPCSIAFGADQFDDPANPKNPRILQSFFNWYYASVGVSLMVALTIIVYIQTEYGWVIGFGVPVGLMLFSTVMFFLGYKGYVMVKPEKSLMTGLAQVLVAAWRKRRHQPPETSEYYHCHDSKLVVPSQKLRCLNKACIVMKEEREINADGSSSDPWMLCSVLQVEVLKSLIQLLPIWSTGIMIAVTISQHTFPVLQASTLDRRFIGNFEIPAASFGIFGILTLTIWVTLYDRAIVPYLSKYTKDPRGLHVKTRIGIGLFISCIAMSVAALVERVRRARAHHQGLADHPKVQVDMSAMWLVPQYCLSGLGEAFNFIGQIELYYSQFPTSMGSIAVALFALGMAIANLVGSAIVNIVDAATKKDGKESWVSNNLNKGHYDYYYWILTILSVVNLIYFVFCSRSYKCCDEKKIWDANVAEDTTTKQVVMVDIMSKSIDSSPSTYFSADHI